MAANNEDNQRLLMALHHPLRRRLLKLAVERRAPLSPREASDIMDLPLSNVSYHMRVLSDCGMVTLTDTTPVRGSVQHFYAVASVVEKTPWVRESLGISTA